MPQTRATKDNEVTDPQGGGSHTDQVMHHAIVHDDPSLETIIPLPQEATGGTDAAGTTAPPAKPATRGRKKKDTQPAAQKSKATRVTSKPSASPAGADSELTSQIGEILQLLKAQATRPVIREPEPRRITMFQPVIELVDGARAALDSRLPTVQGNIDIQEHLTRKSQRRVRDSSIDVITFHEFVYAFIGHILEAQCLDPVTMNKLQFMRQIAEDSESYNWSGVLDWALTTLERINSSSTTWAASQDRAMNRLVISRSVSNAMLYLPIPCPEYNQGLCKQKGAHHEGRFSLEHICTYCAALGIEHPHSDKACHRKKQTSGSQQRSNHSAGHRSEYRQRNYRHNDNYDSRSDSKN